MISDIPYSDAVNFKYLYHILHSDCKYRLVLRLVLNRGAKRLRRVWYLKLIFLKRLRILRWKHNSYKKACILPRNLTHSIWHRFSPNIWFILPPKFDFILPPKFDAIFLRSLTYFTFELWLYYTSDIWHCFPPDFFTHKNYPLHTFL